MLIVFYGIVTILISRFDFIITFNYMAMASDEDQDWPTKKIKRTKKEDRPGICIIHTKTSSSLDLINATKEKQLETLQKVKAERENESHDSPYRMPDEYKMLNQEIHIGDDLGYHRNCYQNFTKNRRRLSDTTIESPTPSSSTKTRSSSAGTRDKVLFTPDCIFCNKTGKKYSYKKGVKTVENTRVFERGGGGGATVQTIAIDKNDENLLARIRDVDLFAAEAHYHPSCRKAYTRPAGLGRSMNIDVRNNQLDLEKTHQKAFESICNTVFFTVIGKKQIIRLDDLREQYIRELNQTSYPNPNYRAEKLKAKLEKHDCIGGEIGFASVMDNTLSASQGKCTSQIIFCKSMDIEGAIKLAYILANVDSFKEVAGLLTVNT